MKRVGLIHPPSDISVEFRGSSAIVSPHSFVFVIFHKIKFMSQKKVFLINKIKLIFLFHVPLYFRDKIQLIFTNQKKK